jgi:hypothetical protein
MPWLSRCHSLWSHGFLSTGYPCHERKQIPCSDRGKPDSVAIHYEPSLGPRFQLNGGIYE